MTRNRDFHLDDSQLVRLIVDETDAPLPVRQHLSMCPACRAEKERLSENLELLSQMVHRHSPSLGKRLVWDDEKAMGFPRFSWNFRRALSVGMVMATAIVILLGSMLFNPPSTDRLSELNREMIEDDWLITEITRLEENALPPLYMEISDEEVSVLDEDFIDFVVPDPGGNRGPLS